MSADEVSGNTLDKLSRLAGDILEKDQRLRRDQSLNAVQREALLVVIVERAKAALPIVTSQADGSSIKGIRLLPLAESRANRKSTPSGIEAVQPEGLYIAASGSFYEVVAANDGRVTCVFLSTTQVSDHYSVIGIANRLLEIMEDKDKNLTDEALSFASKRSLSVT